MKRLTFFIALNILCLCTLTAQWAQIIGLADRSIKDIAAGKNALFAVTADSGSVYRSTDEGITWSLIFPLGGGKVATSPSGTIYVDRGDSLLSSTDNGLSWLARCGGGFSDVEVSPNGTVFCAGFYCGEDACGGSVYRSTDNGLSWDTQDVGAADHISFFTNGTVLLTKFDWFYLRHTVIFDISSDNGLTWNDISLAGGDPSSPDVTALVVSPNNKIFVGLGDLSYSANLCTTWTKLSDIVPEALLALPLGEILAGTNGGGLFLFGESGDSLGTRNEGLTNLNIHALAMDSLGYVYAGTDRGVFRIPFNDSLSSPTMVHHLSAGWNLLSLPLHPLNLCTEVNYPGAQSHAFEYAGCYRECDSLAIGKGYWLKVEANVSYILWGIITQQETIDVSRGWNIIGSLSSPFLASTIIGDPTGIVTGQFWKYDGSRYIASDTIEPGNGYWVRVNQGGRLILSASTTGLAKASASRIRIISTNEMPPLPPGETASIPKAMPKQFALAQNYPNPFNPTTIINYQLPVDSWVTVTIYNVLGQDVKTLVDENQSAGYKLVTWDAANIPSGIYFYRLKAGTFTEVHKMCIIR